MKSISFFLMAACCFLFTLGSCTDDDDSHAEATVSFMGMLTDLEFSIPSETDETDAGSAVPQSEVEKEADTDKLNYGEMISAVFEKLELIGPSSLITESAKITGSSSSLGLAQLQCVQQMQKKVQAKIDAVSLSGIKDLLFSLYEEQFGTANILSANDIPVESITPEFTYIGSSVEGGFVFKPTFK